MGGAEECTCFSHARKGGSVAGPNRRIKQSNIMGREKREECILISGAISFPPVLKRKQGQKKDTLEGGEEDLRKHGLLKSLGSRLPFFLWSFEKKKSGESRTEGRQGTSGEFT